MHYKYNKNIKKVNLSIIIPTYNEEDYLPGLLNDIFQVEPKLCLEIIVADNNSTDKTIDIAKKYKVNIVKGGKPAVARNNGAAVAKGEILLFLDADIRFVRETVERSYADFRKRDLDMAAIQFSCYGGFVNRVNFFLNNVGKIIRQYSRAPMLSGDFMMIKTKTFNKVEGFTGIEMGEDHDLAYKVVKNGGVFRILKSVTINSSDRRYKKIGYSAFLYANLLSLWLYFRGKLDLETSKKRLDKLYGGWGQYSDDPEKE